MRLLIAAALGVGLGVVGVGTAEQPSPLLGTEQDTERGNNGLPSVLQEALTEIRSAKTSAAERVGNLMVLAEALRPRDARAAQALSEEASAIVLDVAEWNEPGRVTPAYMLMPSSGTRVATYTIEAFNYITGFINLSEFVWSFLGSDVVPFAFVNPKAEREAQASATPRATLSPRDQLVLRVIAGVAPGSARAAIDLSTQLTNPFARSLALELTGTLVPLDQGDLAMAAIREFAGTPDTSSISSASLVALSRGARRLDSNVSGELTARAVASIAAESIVHDRALALRQLAESAAESHRPEIRMDLQRLLAETKDSKVGRLAGNGQDHWRELVRLQAVSHAVTGLGLLDPDAARRASNEISFHPLVGAMLIDTIVRPRSGNDKDLRERLLADIVRLNLALSWFHSRPLEAFDILHGLPDAFWSALGKAAFRSHRRIGLGEDVNAYLSAVVVRVKSDWPAAVARPLPGQEAEFTQSSRRFLSVAELLDRAAVEQLSENGDRPLAWPSYLPFALVAAGSSVRGSDTVAASAAFGRALQLANEVSSPAREWALVWNAVAWNAAGSENDRRAAAEAVARASTLRTHRSLEPALAALVGQISRLDASAGLRVARTAHPRLRAGALTAVVAAGRLTH